MVFEPFSIVGVVSFMVGMISFIANTMESLHKRKRLYERCFIKLRGYKTDFEVILRDIKHWQRDWSRSGLIQYEEEEYKYFWGPKGLRKIREILHDLAEDATNIEKIFRFSYEGRERFRWIDFPINLVRRPNTNDINDWNVILNSQHFGSHSEIFLKFSFAIYKNGEIKDLLVDFGERADLLRRTSEGLFWQRHSYASMTKSIEPQYLDRLTTLESSRQEFLQFFKDLYQTHHAAHYHWELILADPYKSDRGSYPPLPDLIPYFHNSRIETIMQALFDRTNLYFRFLNQKSNNINSQSGSMLTVHYPRHRHLSFPALTPNHLPSTNPEIQMSEPLRAYLTNPTLQRSLRNPTTSNDWRQLYEQHQLLSIANYISRAIILLHGTKWSGNACICRILHLQLASPQDRRDILILSSIKDEEEQIDRNCAHFPPTAYRMTFLLLGVLLLELAIAGPIQIQVDSRYNWESNAGEEELLFIVPEEALPPRVNNPLSRSKLLSNFWSMLPETAVGIIGIKYKRAVEECFVMRDRLLDRPGGRTWADELECCSENILKPLEEYCTILRERLGRW